MKYQNCPHCKRKIPIGSKSCPKCNQKINIFHRNKDIILGILVGFIFGYLLIILPSSYFSTLPETKSLDFFVFALLLLTLTIFLSFVLVFKFSIHLQTFALFFIIAISLLAPITLINNINVNEWRTSYLGQMDATCTPSNIKAEIIDLNHNGSSYVITNSNHGQNYTDIEVYVTSSDGDSRPVKSATVILKGKGILDHGKTDKNGRVTLSVDGISIPVNADEIWVTLRIKADGYEDFSDANAVLITTP
jgi:hypothetical protein